MSDPVRSPKVRFSHDVAKFLSIDNKAEVDAEVAAINQAQEPEAVPTTTDTADTTEVKDEPMEQDIPPVRVFLCNMIRCPEYSVNYVIYQLRYYLS